MNETNSNMRPHLNACWTPWNKLSQFSLTDTLKTLVHLGGINFSLDDVEDGNIAVLDVITTLSWCGHHDVLRL